MKKRIFLCLLALLCLSLCVSLASCGDGEENDGGTSTTSSTSGGTSSTGGTASTLNHKHVYGQWKQSKAASCTQNGETERFCSCGAYETQAIPAIGHNFKDGRCSYCGTEAPWSEGVEYTLDFSGEYYIVSKVGTCTDKKIYIRKTYEGKPVKVIEEMAFISCTTVEEVVIPSGIEKIGALAFSACSSLKSVSIADTVKVIGEGAFMSCVSLENVSLGKVEEIGDSAFRGCGKIAEITIPNTVVKMGQEVFEGCVETKISCVVDAKPSTWHENWAGNCENVEFGK